jgi:hypothetical protein
MEIHRRTSGATRWSGDDLADASSTSSSSRRSRSKLGGMPIISRGGGGGGGAATAGGRPSIANAAASNPYNAPPSTSTAFDVVLLRSMQFLASLVVAWFAYLLLVGGDDDAPPNATSRRAIETSLGISSPSPLRKGGSSSDGGIASSSRIDGVSARVEISRMRTEFHDRYGGRDVASEMLKRGLLAFDDGAREVGAKEKYIDVRDDEPRGPIRSTADRFLSAIVRHESSLSSSSSSSTSRPKFVMAFAGYSVTVGRGNHLEEAYPHVLGNILSPALSTLGIELIVRNSAIGGIPSFPYGWCLRNFLGEDADSVR